MRPLGVRIGKQIAIILLTASWLVPTAILAQRAPRSPRDLRKRIEKLLDVPDYQNAVWAIRIEDLGTGNTLYARNDRKSYIPASNTKIYTTAAALTLLGPEYRYVTPLYADAPVENGVLKGNLIVRGSGDPVVGGRFNDGDITETFRQWADSLKALGINRVAGDLIGDDDLFDDLGLGYGWSWDDVPFWYSAEISALSFNDNNIDFEIKAGPVGGSTTISWKPIMTDFISVDNASFTLPTTAALKEGYYRSWDSNQFRFSSEIPAGSVDKESLMVRNPTRFFVHVLREVLRNEGIAVSGRPIDVDDLSLKPDYTDDSMYVVASHTSPPLKDIVHVVNKRSQNLYAEQLLKTMGAMLPLKVDDLIPGSARMGLAREMDTFAAAGMDTSRVHLVDGSGLSRMNLVTAEMTTRILDYMRTGVDDSTRTAFYRSLPVGAVDGDLKNRFRDSPAQGRVHAKTGYVSHARTLSGYVIASNGGILTFSLMCNHYTVSTSKVNHTQDEIVNLLATYIR